MARPQDNARWEAKQRAAGWVRGPRITGDAAERLRALAFQNRLTPAEVVSRLLLDIPLSQRVASDDVTAGFSAQERRDWEASRNGR